MIIINKCQNCLIKQTIRVYKPSSVCGNPYSRIVHSMDHIYLIIQLYRIKHIWSNFLFSIDPFVSFFNTVAFRKLSLQSWATITHDLLSCTKPKKTKQLTYQTHQPGAVICCRRFVLGKFIFCFQPFSSTKESGRAQEEVSCRFFLFKKANWNHCV